MGALVDFRWGWGPRNPGPESMLPVFTHKDIRSGTGSFWLQALKSSTLQLVPGATR
jgi:hypothetical protein